MKNTILGLIGTLSPLFFYIFIFYLIYRLFRFVFGGRSRRTLSIAIDEIESKVSRIESEVELLRLKLADLTKRIEWYESLSSIESEIKRVRAEMAAAASAPSAVVAEKQAAQYFPDKIGRAKAAYKYDKIPVVLAPEVIPSAMLGKPVTFKNFENVIHVICFGADVGTVASGPIADMLSDWLRREDPLRACVTVADDVLAHCAFDIVFYRERSSSRFEMFDDEEEE